MNSLISLGIWMWVSHRSIGCKAAVSPFSPADCPRENAPTSGWIHKELPIILENRPMRPFAKCRRHLVANKHTYLLVFFKDWHTAPSTWDRKYREGIKRPWGHTPNNFKLGLQQKPVLNVHISTIYNSPKVKTSQMSINKWIDKCNVMCPHNVILLEHKKAGGTDTCYSIDEPQETR